MNITAAKYSLNNRVSFGSTPEKPHFDLDLPGEAFCEAPKDRPVSRGSAITPVIANLALRAKAVAPNVSGLVPVVRQTVPVVVGALAPAELKKKTLRTAENHLPAQYRQTINAMGITANPGAKPPKPGVNCDNPVYHNLTSAIENLAAAGEIRYIPTSPVQRSQRMQQVLENIATTTTSNVYNDISVPDQTAEAKAKRMSQQRLFGAASLAAIQALNETSVENQPPMTVTREAAKFAPLNPAEQKTGITIPGFAIADPKQRESLKVALAPYIAQLNKAKLPMESFIAETLHDAALSELLPEDLVIADRVLEQPDLIHTVTLGNKTYKLKGEEALNLLAQQHRQPHEVMDAAVNGLAERFLILVETQDNVDPLIPENLPVTLYTLSQKN